MIEDDLCHCQEKRGQRPCPAGIGMAATATAPTWPGALSPRASRERASVQVKSQHRAAAGRAARVATPIRPSLIELLLLLVPYLFLRPLSSLLPDLSLLVFYFLQMGKFGRYYGNKAYIYAPHIHTIETTFKNV